MILSIPYLNLSVHPFPCSSAYVSWLKTDDVWVEVNFSDLAVRFRWEVAHACTYQDCILRGFNASGIVLQPLCPKLSQLKMTYLNTWEALYQINWEVLNEPNVLGCPKGSKLRPCIYSVWWGFSGLFGENAASLKDTTGVMKMVIQPTKSKPVKPTDLFAIGKKIIVYSGVICIHYRIHYWKCQWISKESRIEGWWAYFLNLKIFIVLKG